MRRPLSRWASFVKQLLDPISADRRLSLDIKLPEIWEINMRTTCSSSERE
jgi:hypothetical protein